MIRLEEVMKLFCNAKFRVWELPTLVWVAADKRPQNGKSGSQKQESKKDQNEAEKFIWRENW